jgi:hypothetical protein
MNERAIDYSFGYSAALPARLKAAHVVTVMRYVGDPAEPKSLRRPEADGLRAAGIGVGFVYETTAQWVLGGHAAGVNAARAAKAHIASLGGPSAPVVYFAADFDVTTTMQEIRISECLRGAATVLGESHVGIYGGLRIVRAAMATHFAAYGWQTTAWSGGVWHDKASLRQLFGPRYGNLGLDYNADDQLAANVGQWGYGEPQPKPEPAMPPTLRPGDHGTHVIALQKALVSHGYRTLKLTGVFDSATEKDVREFQDAHHLVVDGIVGPKTWKVLLDPHA